MNRMTDAARNLLHEELIQFQIVRSCLNCESFIDSTGECTYFQNMKPPPKVVVFSCGEHWENRCPF